MNIIKETCLKTEGTTFTVYMELFITSENLGTWINFENNSKST